MINTEHHEALTPVAYVYCRKPNKISGNTHYKDTKAQLTLLQHKFCQGCLLQEFQPLLKVPGPQDVMECHNNDNSVK